MVDFSVEPQSVEDMSRLKGFHATSPFQIEARGSDGAFKHIGSKGSEVWHGYPCSARFATLGAHI